MADISMCRNETCSLKETCFRFRAKPDEYWQSYAAFKQDEKGECKHYWPVEEKELDKMNREQSLF